MTTLDRIKPLVVLSNGLTHGQERRRDDLMLKSVKRSEYEAWKLGTDWFADESYTDRLEFDTNLTRDHLYKVKGKLVIYGVSAGVSHGANIYGALAEELDELYFIGACGRLARGPVRGRDWRTMEWAAHMNSDEPSPNFIASIDYFQTVTLPILNRNPDWKRRMRLVHQLADPVVPRKTMLIEGVETDVVRTVGHGLGIFAASRLLPRIISQLERDRQHNQARLPTRTSCLP